MFEKLSGARLAKNYQLVYEIIQEQASGTHLAMPEVHALARARRSSIGFTTVYRALTRLRELGLVSEIRLPGASGAVYEPIRPGHAHFRCDACGRIDDIEYRPSASAVRGIARQAGVEISEVVLSLHGRCSACRTPA